jgi:hypothetical protein
VDVRDVSIISQVAAKAATELLVANIKAGAFQDGDMSNEEAEFGRYYDMVRERVLADVLEAEAQKQFPGAKAETVQEPFAPTTARPPSLVPVAPTSISSGVTTSATRATTGTTVRTRRTPTARTSRRRSASSLAPTRSGMPPPSGSIARTPRRGCSTSSGSSSGRTTRFTTPARLFYGSEEDRSAAHAEELLRREWSAPRSAHRQEVRGGDHVPCDQPARHSWTTPAIERSMTLDHAGPVFEPPGPHREGA